MELPVLNGIIDRRILVNYRVKPEIVKALLPCGIEPLTVNGYASAGICLLRLKNIGMKNTPSFMRITSENAAHRFLVKYESDGKEVHGVYIPRRDTDSMLNVLLAGKGFAWPHYAAKFHVREENDRYFLRMKSKDMKTSLEVEAEVAEDFPSDSMFNSLEHASFCFQNSALGISPSTVSHKLKTIELRTKTWAVQPLKIHKLSSSFYNDTAIFPAGGIEFDNALLMRGIDHEWRAPIPFLKVPNFQKGDLKR